MILDSLSLFRDWNQVENLAIGAVAKDELLPFWPGRRPPPHSCVNQRYPIAAQIFLAFSPVNVTSSCVVAPRSK